MDTPVEDGQQSLYTVGFTHAKDQFGNWWVNVGRTHGAITINHALPLDQAIQIAEQELEGIKQAVAAGKRERSGLIVAGPRVGSKPNRRR